MSQSIMGGDLQTVTDRDKIVYKPLPKDDPIKRKPDIGLAKKELNWEPKIDIDEGLEKTINYFTKKLKENKYVKKGYVMFV